MNDKSRKAISITDGLFRYMLTTLNEDHCVDESDHLLFVEVVEGVFCGYPRNAAYGVDITLGVVLVRWSPSRNDLGNSSAVVVANVTTDEDKASAHTIDHRNELLEVGVCGFSDFAKPYVTYPDVERVVIADAARYGLFLIHRDTDIMTGKPRHR